MSAQAAEKPEYSLRARETARFMQKYAKKYAAGAFATPTAAEIDANPASIVIDRDLHGGVVVYAHRTLKTQSIRTDFVGNRFVLPPGTRIVTHLARSEGAPLPDMTDFDVVMAYTEDGELVGQLLNQNLRPLFTRVTAASELITAWTRQTWALNGPGYAKHDVATAVRFGTVVSGDHLAAVRQEIINVTQWDDDFPYYSDGSWSAVSLRGFYPGDPRKGVKPSEMPRSWKEKHPGDLQRVCDWTTLAAKLPQTKALVENITQAQGFKGLERVRLLRMQQGKLNRHTDITDKAAGLADGKIARFHVPLVTHPAIKMKVWDLGGQATEHHLDPGSLWYLDARKPHSVANPVEVDRIHLVIDVVSDGGLRSLIGGAA